MQSSLFLIPALTYRRTGHVDYRQHPLTHINMQVLELRLRREAKNLYQKEPMQVSMAHDINLVLFMENLSKDEDGKYDKDYGGSI